MAPATTGIATSLRNLSSHATNAATIAEALQAEYSSRLSGVLNFESQAIVSAAMPPTIASTGSSHLPPAPAWPLARFHPTTQTIRTPTQ